MSRNIFLLAAVVWLVNSMVLALGQELDDEVVDRLRAAIEYEVEAKDLPAFSLSLVDGDRVVWAGGFGVQDAFNPTAATAETVYRVGSVSKLFTDIAVMQLVEQDKLDLDAPVQDYLPDFRPDNPFESSITLRQLMSHQSGLVREPPVGHYFDPDEPSLQATVASLNKTSLVYRPESRTKYSNAAVAVVGSVLERVAGMSHPEYVRKHLLDPLDMQHSDFVLGETVESQLATGWMRTYDGRRFEAPRFLLGTGPAGNMYSSVLDLSKFLSCMFREGKGENGRLLAPETLAAMMTPVHDAQGNPQRFGLGFSLSEIDDHAAFGHGGAVYGFSTQLIGIPEQKLGVAAVVALDGANGVVRKLAEYALRLQMAARDGKPLPDYPRTVAIDPERAKELTGIYRQVAGDGMAFITQLDGHVYLRRGTFRYELRATADDGRIITDDPLGHGLSISREHADSVRIDEKLHERTDASPPAAPPQRWEGLIGEYGWDHNTLYILEDHGQLFALIEWFYYYPLEEIDRDVFAFPDYGLYHGEQLHFERSAEGRATRVVAAEVEFKRREVGTVDGETFKITPVRPIDELRDAAMEAAPPEESGDFRESDLVDIKALDDSIQTDIRYATTNNFTGSVFYKQPRAFMQRPAAEAVVRAHRQLEPRGLGLLIHDAYRPWHVTKMFWDATPDELKDFVANPANGSRHNRGCAVDLTLFDRQTGKPIEMVAGYDEFSPRSFPLYPGGTSRQRWYRELLRRTMEDQEFTVYEFEWWHFDYQDWEKYRIENRTFEQLE